MPHLMRLLLVLFLSTTMLRADTLSDLKETLRRFDNSEPVSATVEFAFSDRSGDEKKPQIREGRATARSDIGSEGLRVLWSAEQLAAAAKEAEAASGKPETPAPTREAMSRLSAAEIQDYLSAGTGLSRRLAIAKLLGEKTELWNGQSARVLSFELEPPLSAEDRKMIKEISGTARVWIATDGTPLAAESALSLKGRAMLVISFQHSEQERFTFARVGNRLVVTFHHRETADEGGGQHTQSKTDVTLRLAGS